MSCICPKARLKPLRLMSLVALASAGSSCGTIQRQSAPTIAPSGSSYFRSACVQFIITVIAGRTG
jgi:hypothetical protein